MKRDIKGKTVRLLWAVELGTLLSVMAGWSGLVSPLFSLSFVLLALLWLLAAEEEMHRLTFLTAALAALALIHVLLNALLAGQAVTPSYLRKWAMFAAAAVTLLLGATLTADGRTGRFLLRGNTLLAVSMAALFLIRRREMYLLNGAESAYLTFGFSNPNTAGMFLAAVCGLELVSLRGSRARWERLLHLATVLCTVYFLLESGSRTALLALITEGVFFLCSLAGPAPKFSRFLCAGMAVLPLAFAVGYLLLARLPGVEQMMSELAEQGKALDSRRSIWVTALTHVRGSPLLGAYSQLGGSFQMHNSHLDTLASYGASVLVLTCGWLYRLLRLRSGGGALSPVRLCCLGGFCAMLVLGVGEAALFSGGLGIHLFAGVFLLLAGIEPDEKGGRES